MEQGPSDKKKDIIALGVYPNVSLKEARMLRNEAKVLIQKGIDPKQHNREEKKLEEQAAQNTFQQIAQQWFSGFQADTEKRSLKHTKRVYRSLEIHVFPFLGKRQIDTIMPMDVLEIARAVEREGKGDTAHRVLSAIKMVFGYAVRMRICLFNPASDLSQELKSIKQKHFPTITDPDDLGKLLVDIEGWTGAPQVRALLNLSPLVFTRPSEVRTYSRCSILLKRELILRSFAMLSTHKKRPPKQSLSDYLKFHINKNQCGKIYHLNI